MSAKARGIGDYKEASRIVPWRQVPDDFQPRRFDRLAMLLAQSSQQIGINYNSDSPAGRAPTAFDIRPNLAQCLRKS